MAQKVLRYDGKDILVTYDVKKCIHAAECIHGLRSVFDPDGRPWINADGAPADEIARVIHRCPSGALQYERHDDGPPEPIPTTNTISIEKDGPLHVRGNVKVLRSDGTVVTTTTRMALCRCGLSSNKPFCDNSHVDADFTEPGALSPGGANVADEENDGRLVITAADNGFLRIAGPVTLLGADGEERNITRATLCRCGASNRKPFCDSSHREIGFTTS